MQRVCTIGLALCLATVATLSEARPAGASDRPRTIVVEGRGYGHGIGMGQWGAYRRAQNGATWHQIVTHYYRDARVIRTPRSRARVLVRTAQRLTVSGREPIRVRSRRGWIASAQRVRITRDADMNRVLLRRDGRWRTIATRRGFISLRSAAPMWLAGAGQRNAYRGRFRVIKYAGALGAVNIVGIEAYLRGVLPPEMPASWPAHALRAQAVAARSYTVRVKEVARARGARYDICATTMCQVYAGMASRSSARARPQRIEHPRATDAIRATRGRVLVAGGRTVLAMYSSSTGGHTTSGGSPGLRPVRDRADRASPYHRWRTQIPASSIRAAWPRIGRLLSARVVARDGAGGWGGRAQRVRLAGTRGSITVSAATFRSTFGLRSDWFRLRGSSAPYRFRFNMGYGTSHPAVRALQDRLRREGFYPQDAPRTSYFGPITRRSVRRYQRAHGIQSTGYLGPITRGHLNRRA